MKVRILGMMLILGSFANISSADVLVNVSHEVKDYDMWKRIFDSEKKMFKTARLKLLYVSRNTEKSNNVLVLFKGRSAAEAKEFLTSDRTKKVMEAAGILAPPRVEISEIVKK